MKSAGKRLDFSYAFYKADKLPKDVYTIKNVKNIGSDDFQKVTKVLQREKISEKTCNSRKNVL